jgi:calcineurin-like phosphoesterase family protein
MKNGMRYWIITDTHFGHGAMKQMCGRPDFFEDKIIKNLRQLLRPADVLIHLGDMAFYKHEYWSKELMSEVQGKKWLVKGNHDKKSISWFMANGWDFVAEEFTLKMFGKKILFSHRPSKYVDGVDLNIHGHHHNTNHHPEDVMTDKHRLVHIEDTFSPVLLRNIVERSEKNKKTP